MRGFKLFQRRQSRSSTPIPPNRSFRPSVTELEERLALTIVVPPVGMPGPVTITGTTTSETFIIRFQPGVPSNIQFSDDGGATFTTSALADVTNITVSSSPGNDILQIDDSNGLVGKPT